MSNDNVSSAEVTAYMRSQYPELTHDKISEKIVSDAGIKKHFEFIEGMDYPLATRKIAVRAGYIYEQASHLLATGDYDSCISLASGFSLLLHLLSKQHPNVECYDVDLPHMIVEREARIEEARIFSDEELHQVNVKSIDLTQIDTLNLQEVFSDCKKPLFILEGISYFLPEKIVSSVLQQITEFKDSAIIVDYWPDNSLEISAIFKRIMHQLKGFIAEDVNSFLKAEQIDTLHGHYQYVEDISILQADEMLSKKINQKPLLINQDEVFPIRIMVAH